MDELRALRSLARLMGVHPRFTDGLGHHVVVAPETLVRVCAALGAPITRPGDAADALRAYRATRHIGLPSALVAWDGHLPLFSHRAKGHRGDGGTRAQLRLADGEVILLAREGEEFRSTRILPFGYHHLVVETGDWIESCTVIAAPVQAWRRPGSHRSWGVGSHLAALRSSRSRSVGDLKDLEAMCRWVRERGGDVVTVLPLLPTFNGEPPESSPYSPVSRLFWSELVLDLGHGHHPTPPPDSLDVRVADAEVRTALAGQPTPGPELVDDELLRYARFRGAQARLGRNWRDWPATARAGILDPGHIDPEEARFHLVAQVQVRHQLHEFRQHLEQDRMRVGLDLAVGVHPDGYDPWSRQHLFAEGMSVGAPPDLGFPSGQDWGFTPVGPEASRREGHRYLAASIAHQAGLAGLLRVDHIMAWTRLYWIPHGFGLHQGTYVSYPAEELFAILSLESNLHHCEVVGENLGTVPREIFEALPRHRIWGMYLAEFQASGGPEIAPPTAEDMALIGTHDTPTFAGWLAGNDIVERVRYGLLAEEAAPKVRLERVAAVRRLAEELKSSVDEPQAFLAELLAWLGRSDSPVVVPWLEDLWREERGVNLPGTRSSVRPNWQRPMRRLLEDIFNDPRIEELLRRLTAGRAAGQNDRSGMSS
ncbi:MAG: 4-alpha-glucanotransferase [Gemmatimonadota bacterium]